MSLRRPLRHLTGRGGSATAEERQWLARQSVAPKLVALLTRQLSALLRGGVPLVQALHIMAEQPEAPHLGLVMQDVAAQVAAGTRFSAALYAYPRVFGKLFVTMVQVGESSGQLDLALGRLSDWVERDVGLRHRLQSALTYPAFVLALALVLTLLLFRTILPGFVSIFEEMQAPLPPLTRLVVGLTRLVGNPVSWIGALLALAAAVWWLRQVSREPRQYAALFALLLRVPLLGALLWHGSAARYCAALDVLLTAGLDMRRALPLAAAASGSPMLEQDAAALVQSVMDGNPVSTHMVLHPETYSATLTHLTVAGEEASRLPEMLVRAAYFHELEMNGKIQALSAALEPLLLAGVSLVVGTILISIFLPLYGILSTLGS